MPVRKLSLLTHRPAVTPHQNSKQLQLFNARFVPVLQVVMWAHADHRQDDRPHLEGKARASIQAAHLRVVLRKVTALI